LIAIALTGAGAFKLAFRALSLLTVPLPDRCMQPPVVLSHCSHLALRHSVKVHEELYQAAIERKE
jgi:hypothetical protein